MTQAALQAYRSFIECQIRHASGDGGAVIKPFVTISRQTGAGGITIGQALVQYLKEHDTGAKCPWTLFDRNIVQCVVEEHHLSKDTARFMHEKKTSEIKDIMETLFNLHPPAFALVKRTSETILHLAQMGYSVIVGRGGNIVTHRLKGGLHVRLIASLETRVKHTAEYYGLSSSEAAQKVENEDLGRRDYVKQNFGKNIDDLYLYDLIINTDHISYDRAARMIAEAVLSLKNN